MAHCARTSLKGVGWSESVAWRANRWLCPQFVPDDLKDDKYWARRRKNNMAAKRSRDARRMKENRSHCAPDISRRRWVPSVLIPSLRPQTLPWTWLRIAEGARIATIQSSIVSEDVYGTPTLQSGTGGWWCCFGIVPPAILSIPTVRQWTVGQI